MRYDVAVVGGGLVGAAAALTVAAGGRSVALIEPHPPEVRRGSLGMDPRTVAVSQASKQLLERCQAWTNTATAYHEMQVWEERGTARISFAAAEAGEAALGWIAEVSPLAAHMWHRAEHHPRIATLTQASVSGLVTDDAAVAVELGESQVEARLLLAADGAQSTVRELAGVAASSDPTGHSATATIARMAEPHEGVARQRFLTNGPLALLPGSDSHLVSVVWSQSHTEAERRQSLDDDSYRAELTIASGGALGDVLEVDRRFCFPLTQRLADRFDPHPRVLLIGDAARVLHPLAGLGVNLGFEDVEGIAGVLAGVGTGDPGAEGVWRAFARRRRARARAMLDTLTLLRRIYAWQDPAAGLLRNAGVRMVDANPALKRQIMREAMGFGPIATALRA